MPANPTPCKILATFAAAAALSACVQAPGALPDPALGWSIDDVSVTIAHDAELFWCETRYGCANVAERVSETVQNGLDTAVEGVEGARGVRLEAEVARFEGLTMAEAFTSGGRYDVAISLRARDILSGADLAPPRSIVIDHFGMGGLLLLVAEGGQRERLAAEIAHDVRLWMAEAGELAASGVDPADLASPLATAIRASRQPQLLPNLPGARRPDPTLPRP